MENYMGRIETTVENTAYKMRMNFSEIDCTQAKRVMKRSFKMDTLATYAIIFDNTGKVVLLQKRLDGKIVTIEEVRRVTR